MAKKLVEVSDEERKVLEGTEAGKALLKKLEAAEETVSTIERAKLDAETKLSSTEKARKDLEDSLLNPDFLEVMANKRKPAPAREADEENLDELPPTKIVAKIRQEMSEKLDALQKDATRKLDAIKQGVSAALQVIQIEALEDKHGEKFTSRKTKLAEFSTRPENQSLRPRDVYAKFVDAEELEAKRAADAAVKATEEARQKEIASFAENPEESIAPGAVSEKDKPKNDDEAFDRAWQKTVGADKLLRQD